MRVFASGIKIAVASAGVVAAIAGASLAQTTKARKTTAPAKVSKAVRSDASVVRESGSVGLTLYSQNFAVVRHPVRLNLKTGVNKLRFENVASFLETDSVVLRDRSSQRSFDIREQSYRNDAAAPENLLPRFVGKTLRFLVSTSGSTDSKPQIVTGKLIRLGGINPNGGFGSSISNEALVEVDGEVRFGLPGTPLFPAASLRGMRLSPTLEWTLLSAVPQTVTAELAYVSGGFDWQASYNVVAPEHGDQVDLTGWVTMSNTSGRSFPSARIQLVAGDVRKLQPDLNFGRGGFGGAAGGYGGEAPSSVSERAFDEYHLYTLNYPTTLGDREQKQVEMARGTGILSTRVYVYDGEQTDPVRYDWRSRAYYNPEASYNRQSNTKVWVMREFANTKANGLGMPLPKGRMRVYRRDDETGALHFVGEGLIGHTPKDERIRLYTGDAFDVVGERRRVEVTGSEGKRQETLEIKVRNHKRDPVDVRVVEHLHPPYGNDDRWEIVKNSDPWTKLDALTIEFRVTVKPDEEKVVTYSVNY